MSLHDHFFLFFLKDNSFSNDSNMTKKFESSKRFEHVEKENTFDRWQILTCQQKTVRNKN